MTALSAGLKRAAKEIGRRMALRDLEHPVFRKWEAGMFDRPDYDIDRPVEPPPGWAYCSSPTCGVWLRKDHPIGTCKACRQKEAA